jgi:hypothetical protein
MAPRVANTRSPVEAFHEFVPASYILAPNPPTKYKPPPTRTTPSNALIAAARVRDRGLLLTSAAADGGPGTRVLSAGLCSVP